MAERDKSGEQGVGESKVQCYHIKWMRYEYDWFNYVCVGVFDTRGSSQREHSNLNELVFHVSSVEMGQIADAHAPFSVPVIIIYRLCGLISMCCTELSLKNSKMPCHTFLCGQVHAFVYMCLHVPSSNEHITTRSKDINEKQCLTLAGTGSKHFFPKNIQLILTSMY